MIASVCKRRKFKEDEVVFLYNGSVELFNHGTPASVGMKGEAVVGMGDFPQREGKEGGMQVTLLPTNQDPQR